MGSKVRCSVRFGKFKWRRGGYLAVKSSPVVQSMLRAKADAVCAKATSLAGGNGKVIGPAKHHPQDTVEYKKIEYKRPPFTVYQVTLPVMEDLGFVVITSTRHGMKAQAKDKALTKALDAARG